MTNIFLAVLVVCSNAFTPTTPDTSCRAFSTVYPTLGSCEGTNTALRGSLQESNKKRHENTQLYLAFMDCVELERPDLNQPS